MDNTTRKTANHNGQRNSTGARLSAEELARELGRGAERRVGRSWRAPCPAHEDRHPSLDLTDKNGLTLVVCRAGCAQSAVLDALRARGLWRPASAPRRPAFRWENHLLPERTIPSCCLEVPQHVCAHWREFNRQMILGELHKNLVEAYRELIEKFKAADRPVTFETLRKDVKFAIPFGAIVPAGVGNEIVEKAITLVAGEVAR